MSQREFEFDQAGEMLLSCSQCKDFKPLETFHRDARAPFGRARKCKDCTPKKESSLNLEKTYGISEARYRELLQEQQRGCRICGGDNNGKRLVVDHNHQTGQVRGLLCGTCNAGLGMFKEDVSYMEEAIRYLIYYRHL